MSRPYGEDELFEPRLPRIGRPALRHRARGAERPLWHIHAASRDETLPDSPTRIRGTILRQGLVALTPSIDGVVSELRVANLYIRPNNSVGKQPHVTTRPHSTTLATTYGLISQVGLYVPQSNYYLTSYLDGTSSTFVGSRVVDGHLTAGALNVADGLMGAFGTVTTQIGSELLNTGIQLQVWRDRFRLGMAGIWGNATNTNFAALGVFGQVLPGAALLDLGEYIGPDAQLLAKAHHLDLEKDGMRRVELRRQYNALLNVRGGGGTFWLAALLRLNASRARKKIYRTMVSTQTARNIVFEGHGLRRYFRDRARALGWHRDVLTIPPLHKPKRIKLDDELTVSKTGTFILDLVVGNLTLWAGLQILARGDVEITVHRLEDDRLEMTVNALRLRDKKVFGYSPFGPTLDLGSGKAWTAKQGFVFDMKTRAGKHAYFEAINGRFPRVPLAAQVNQEPQRGEGALAKLVSRQNAAFPRGVERSYVHVVTTRETRVGGGGHFGVFPKDFLPYRWTNTLGMHKTQAHEQQTITDGQSIDRAATRSQEKRRELLMHGINTDAINTQQRWVREPNSETQFWGLTLASTLTRTCVRGLRANNNLINPVNRIFGTRFPQFTRHAKKEQRELELARVFAADALPSLLNQARLFTEAHNLPHGERAAVSLRLQRLAQALHLKPKVLVALLRDFAAARGEAQQAEVLQKFVQKYGLVGMGAVHQMLPGGSEPLSASTASSGIISPLVDTRRLTLKYPDRIAHTDDPRAVYTRLRDVGRALRDCLEAQKILQEDPLVDDFERPLLAEELQQAEAELRALLGCALDPIQRASLAARMARSGWRARRDSACRYVLEGQDAWVVHCEALARAGTHEPLPSDPRTVYQRFGAIFEAAVQIQARLYFVEHDTVFYSPHQKALAKQKLRRAQFLLLGDVRQNGFPARPPRGVLDVGAYDLSALRTLFKADAQGAPHAHVLRRYVQNLLRADARVDS